MTVAKEAKATQLSLIDVLLMSSIEKKAFMVSLSAFNWT